jgi:hypothetical protein
MFLFISESYVFSLVLIRTSAILGHVPITDLFPKMGVYPTMGNVPINVNAVDIGRSVVKLYMISANVLLRRRIHLNVKLSYKCFLMFYIHRYLLAQIANRVYQDITRVADACPAVHHTSISGLAAYHCSYAKIVKTQRNHTFLMYQQITISFSQFSKWQ